MSTGIIMVQHGDFPFDFKKKNKDMFKFIKQMLEEISQETRQIARDPDDPYNSDMQRIKDSLQQCGNIKHLEVGYMEFSSPTIAEAVEKIAREGVKRIILVNSPGIFMRSSHSLLDIPPILEQIQSTHPDLELTYAPPGGFLDEIADVMVKRINNALDESISNCQIKSVQIPEEYGVVLIAHGDVPLSYLEEQDMNRAEEQVEKWSEMVRQWPRDEDNDPLSHDTLALEKFIEEKGGYSNFEIGNLEFASPTLKEALDKVLKRGADKVIFIGGTGFMDRSSHSLVDIPEAIEKLQKLHPFVEMTYQKPDIELVCTELAQIITSKVEKVILGKPF